jgi:hypothetical protein
MKHYSAGAAAIIASRQMAWIKTLALSFLAMHVLASRMTFLIA